MLRHAIGMVPKDDVKLLEEEDDEYDEGASGSGSIFTDPVYMVPLLIVILGILYKFVYLPQKEADL